MILKCGAFDWPGTELKEYKDTPGSHLGVIRRKLGGDGACDFQARYFEVAPGGYTSFERHEHEHFVVVLRGSGRVRLGDEWHDVEQFDVVSVGPNVPHQFRNGTQEPFGILCIVDSVRDRPVLLDTTTAGQASE